MLFIVSYISEYASIGCTAEVGEYCVFMQEPTTDQMNWDTSSVSLTDFGRKCLAVHKRKKLN